jgi:two-component system sensor histidine kinase UhpB
MMADPDFARLADAFNDALERIVLYRRKLGEAAARATRQEEEERDRVAQALHEDTAQRLAALLVRLRLAAAESDALEGLLEETRDQIATAIEVIRGYAISRRPRVLEELGLEAAVEAYANELSDAGLNVEVEAEELDRNPPLELELYRIVREALDNVAMHSAAEHAMVKIARENGRISVSVEDDGRGFDVEEALAGDALGLFEMRERAAAAGATLDVESRPGEGTRVRATILEPAT